MREKIGAIFGEKLTEKSKNHYWYIIVHLIHLLYLQVQSIPSVLKKNLVFRHFPKDLKILFKCWSVPQKSAKIYEI